MLTFIVKKEWFEKIKSGEKTHEYREVKPYWIKRIRKEFDYLNCDIEELKEAPKYPLSYVSFVCGYANKNDKCRRLKANIVSIQIVNGINTDLNIDTPVFDIEFELINEKGC